MIPLVMRAFFLDFPAALYADCPHGMPTTEADTINTDLLAFFKGTAEAAA